VLVVLTTAMIVELIGIHADNVLFAISKHKYLAYINIIEAVLNITLSIIFAHLWGIIGVAVGTALPLLFFRLFVIPQLVCKYLELSVWTYYRSLVPVTAYTIAYLALCNFLVQPFLAANTYGAIALAGIACAPLYAVTIPYIGFSADERAQLHRALPIRLQRFTAPLLGR
jgi:O-antigen/teichoic acid export membrane protein